MQDNQYTVDTFIYPSENKGYNNYKHLKMYNEAYVSSTPSPQDLW